MTPAVASERSIFIKNHDYNSYHTAENFRGAKYSRFLRINLQPRKFSLRKLSYMHLYKICITGSSVFQLARSSSSCTCRRDIDRGGMALYRYFKVHSADSILPDPRGPLSNKVPSTAIASANEEVKNVVQQQAKLRARGPYTKFTAEQRAAIGKRAAEHGVAATMRYYEKQYPNGDVKDSSVRMWGNAYTSEIKKRRGE